MLVHHGDHPGRDGSPFELLPLVEDDTAALRPLLIAPFFPRLNLSVLKFGSDWLIVWGREPEFQN
jgi:hypothetical protein